VKFGGSSVINSSSPNSDLPWTVEIENFNRALGAHKTIIQGVGEIVNNDGSGVDVNLRSGGGDEVLEILFNGGSSDIGFKAPDNMSSLDFANILFEAKFHDISAVAHTLTLYIQSQQALTADECWMELEYVDSYDDDTEYTKKIVKSTNTVDARSDADDWTQTLTAAFTPATASGIIVRVFYAKYHATNKVYIDKVVDIS
jgi:hypothetical protein